MVILRSSDIREKDEAELESDLAELRKTLMKIRGGLASGGIPEDVGKVREIKKTIARILTIKHEQKLGLVHARKHEQKPKKIFEKAKESSKEEKKTLAEETLQSDVTMPHQEEARKKTTKKTKEPKEVTPKK